MRRILVSLGIVSLASCTQLLGGSALDNVHPADAGSDSEPSWDDDGTGNPNPFPRGGDYDAEPSYRGDAGHQDAADDVAPRRDAETPDAPDDDAADGFVPDRCSGPLAAGDLAIVELMIASVTGSGDRGEWVEVTSTRDCTLNLKGLHASSPRGATGDTLDVADDTWLPAHGSFLIGDSIVPAINDGLPGLVFAWDGSPSDTLKNSGDTVTLSAGAVTVDTVTYGTVTVTAGTSLEFPAVCAASDRGTWSKWQASTSTYGTTPLHGTPNAANSDVTCP